MPSEFAPAEKRESSTFRGRRTIDSVELRYSKETWTRVPKWPSTARDDGFRMWEGARSLGAPPRFL